MTTNIKENKEGYTGKRDINCKKIYFGDVLKNSFGEKYIVVRSFGNGHVFRHCGPIQAVERFLRTEECENIS